MGVGRKGLPAVCPAATCDASSCGNLWLAKRREPGPRSERRSCSDPQGHTALGLDPSSVSVAPLLRSPEGQEPFQPALPGLLPVMAFFRLRFLRIKDRDT